MWRKVWSAVLLTALFACSGSSGGTSEIRMQDNIFDPDVIEVAGGQELTFVNRGRVDHNVIADDGTFDSRKPDEANQKPGDSWSLTVDSPGTYAYYCSLHAIQDNDGKWQGMVGTVIVNEQATGG